MTINTGILRIYFANNRQLIPISFDDPHKLKRPLHKNWTERVYTPDDVTEFANRGFNLGWRLGPGDVVIDVDPRNGGTEGLALLLEDFQRGDPNIEDLGDVFPAVKTGGGGFHFYGCLDPSIKIKNNVSKYGPGVEFKTVGRQVIIPGSTHPSGGVYSFDDFSDATGPSTPLPQWLVATIRRDTNGVTTPLGALRQDAELSVDELSKLLSHLPVDEYNTNDDWFQIMAAAHEATGGVGLEVFVDWSLGDANYIGHDELIRNRWRSFESGKGGNIGLGTLFREVARHGGELPPMSLASPSVAALGDLPPSTSPPPPRPNVTHTVDRAQLDTDIAALGLTSTAADIKVALVQVSRVDALDQESYIQAIREKTGRTIAALKKAMGKVRAANMTEDNVDIDDMGLEVTTYLLKNKFANGAHLVHGKDQRFWEYNGTHWTPMEDNIIDNLLLKASYQYRQQHPNILTPVASLIGQGEKVLRARRAVKQNLNEPPDGRPPVVNTLNCEVWIDPDTGKVTPREHSPDSWLTTRLETNFNPGAKCPMFSKSLVQMFQKNPDHHDIIRHLWEVIGYIIQPQKDLAAWVLLHGEGANGKTVVLNVITRLLGKAALNKPIEELDTKRNNHALADLPNKLCVIDEDLDAKTVLPDAILKKISESKVLQANPKLRPSFDFLNTAIILFASNEFPRIKDLSNGMRRRALVFNFNRTFADHEQDLGLAKRIVDNEMDGVLIEALKGFRRLRQRGGWDVPQSCAGACKQWLIKSNTISEFVDEVMVPAKGGQIEFKRLFSIYRMWCAENGYTHPSTKPNFSKALTALGIEIGRGAGNKVTVKEYTAQNMDFDLGTI